MWKKTKWYLIVASVAMNVAFVAMWIAYADPLSAHPENSGQRETHHKIWCPLHRELGVTEEQWAQIGPRLREFQAAEELLGVGNGQIAQLGQRQFRAIEELLGC